MDLIKFIENENKALVDAGKEIDNSINDDLRMKQTKDKLRYFYAPWQTGGHFRPQVGDVLLCTLHIHN